ncbi:MAG: hypothetical protein JSU87_02590 [Gemmatimonadota bacterium]|nr:MAG: hypothetical protein JSU87_02590 [Gemmatimonadota bacterium]
MTADELDLRLEVERIVPVAASEWSAVAERFEEMERHPTGVAGDIVIIQVAAGLAAVEQSSPAERVVRRLGGPDEARRFVEQRLEAYERMWDGCGCKIDYYK